MEGEQELRWRTAGTRANDFLLLEAIMWVLIKFFGFQSPIMFRIASFTSQDLTVPELEKRKSTIILTFHLSRIQPQLFMCKMNRKVYADGG